VPIRSAGLLVYRVGASGVVEVLIAHPGGPFWSRKDAGAWTVPKGEYEDGADPLAAAEREFAEETGLSPPEGARVFLADLRQPSGKRVSVWATEGDLNVTAATSNTFELEWPRGSGTLRTFPEVDQIEWMTVERARGKLLKGQVGFLDHLMEGIRARAGGPVWEGADAASD
jgi:predicted NUDIX family NTP pyrophosphohydrolase